MQLDPYAWRINHNPVMTATDQRLADDYNEIQVRLATEILLPKARVGERWAALRLLEICGSIVMDGSRVTGPVSAWLSEVLLHLARGDTLEEAASIRPRDRGAKKEGIAEVVRAHRERIAYHVGYLRIVEKAKLEYAYQHAADAHHCGIDAAKKAWNDLKGPVIEFIALQQRSLGKVRPITLPDEVRANAKKR